MAEIPVSSIVNVSITLTPTAPQRAGFGTLLFITTDAENLAALNPIPTSEGVRYYASVEELADDWNPGDEVLIAGTTYFSQSPKPTAFGVGAIDAGDADLTATLTRLQNISDAWYAFALELSSRDSADINLAAIWAEARTKQFYTTTNDANSLIAGDNADILFDLNAAGYTRTFVQYSRTAAEYPEVSSFARAATVDFNFDNATLTLKFKDNPTITPETMTTGELNALIAKGGNALNVIGGVRTLSEGIMVKGVGTYQDTIHGVDWLQDAIQTNVYGLLITQKKIPLTDKGAAAIEQQVIDALEQGVRNGLIAPGEASDGTFYATGYSTTVGKVADMALTDRQQRKAPPISFVAVGAGAIHSVVIQGTFEA